MKATHNSVPAAPHLAPLLGITTDTDPMRPSALLRGAATYLKAYGWTKGQFFELLADTDQPFVPACASGAIVTAACGSNLSSFFNDADDPQITAAISAMRVLAAWLDVDCDSTPYVTSAIDVIGDWNDDKGRTLDEVLEALTEAADDWETAHPTGGAR